MSLGRKGTLHRDGDLRGRPPWRQDPNPPESVGVSPEPRYPWEIGYTKGPTSSEQDDRGLRTAEFSFRDDQYSTLRDGSGRRRLTDDEHFALHDGRDHRRHESGDEYEDEGARADLERELQDLQEQSRHEKKVLDSLADQITTLKAEVEEQRRRKPAYCNSCSAVTLQVDAAAQSLLGAAGHVARTLLRDVNADRAELLDTVMRYLEPVKHLDPELEELYARAQVTVDQIASERERVRTY